VFRQFMKIGVIPRWRRVVTGNQVHHQYILAILFFNYTCLCGLDLRVCRDTPSIEIWTSFSESFILLPPTKSRCFLSLPFLPILLLFPLCCFDSGCHLCSSPSPHGGTPLKGMPQKPEHGGWGAGDCLPLLRI
jgi:hypothetical protein